MYLWKTQVRWLDYTSRYQLMDTVHCAIMWRDFPTLLLSLTTMQRLQKPQRLSHVGVDQYIYYFTMFCIIVGWRQWQRSFNWVSLEPTNRTRFMISANVRFKPTDKRDRVFNLDHWTTNAPSSYIRGWTLQLRETPVCSPHAAKLLAWQRTCTTDLYETLEGTLWRYRPHNKQEQNIKRLAKVRRYNRSTLLPTVAFVALKILRCDIVFTKN